MRAVLGLHKKFNAILNDAAAHFGYYRMYLESCSADYQYDRMGKMNDQGLLDMWHEIDKLLEKFDCKKIDLNPVAYNKEKKDYLQWKHQEKNHKLVREYH